MSSIVLSGDTSGTVTVAVPAVAGTNTVTIAAQTGTLNAAGPAFYAYKNGGTQTVSSGAFTKITFNTEAFDTNSNFASSTFTPTVAGYYQINASYSVEGIGTVTRMILSIYKNGTEYIRPYDLVGTGNQAPGTALVYMNGSTDYVEIYCYITGVGTLGVRGAADGNVYTYFQGSLVRGA